MSSLSEFVTVIRSEAEQIKERNTDPRVPTEVIFSDAIHRTLIEIKRGADSRAFSDLVFINFIISAAKEGYTAQEIKKFADAFTDEHDVVYSEDLEEQELPLIEDWELSATQ